VPGTTGDAEFGVLDMEFFDEESLVIVYQGYAAEGPGVIALVDYAEIEYGDLDVEYVKYPSREAIVAEAIAQLQKCTLVPVMATIRKRRALKLARRTGTAVSLCVNGRAGRRVACVLDGDGVALELLDMEGEDGGDGEGSDGGGGDE